MTTLQPVYPLTRATLARLLEAATAAPSLHNSQPWRFRCTARSIEVHADPRRSLPYADPAGRAVHLACGAAALQLRLAALATGTMAAVRLLPDPGHPTHLATVRLAGPHRPSPPTLALYAAIPRRHTSRAPFADRPVPDAVRGALAEAATLEGARLHLLDPAEGRRVLGLVADADRVQQDDPRYRAEVGAWTGNRPGRTDGVPPTAVGTADASGRVRVRDFSGGGSPRPAVRFEANPLLAVLVTTADARADWLRAGAALARVLLTATAQHLATSIFSQPVELPETRWLLRDPRRALEHPQLVLRFGYGPPGAPTPRRPWTDVLDD